jgi:hydroxymethylbilane synthase
MIAPAARIRVALRGPMAQSLLRIGSRGSPLALTQARQVRDLIAAARGLDAAAIEIRVIRTTGDQIQDRPLAEVGGKGLFTKEIEQALLDREIDLAVHSAKDMPTILPDGLVLTACLEREDVRDAFVCRKVATLAALPSGAVVGTASLRRQAMVKRLRPDLQVANFRGNVETRLRKIDEGVADATLLAMAGLKRLGLVEVASEILSVDQFTPAVGQGAIAIETRADDSVVRAIVASVDHAETREAVAAERAFLAVLDGSCRTPIAGHAIVEQEAVRFRGMILKPDGSEFHETACAGSRRDAEAIGAQAGRELKGRAPADFFSHG